MKRTIQNIIEEVQQIFPVVGETQIIYDLDKIQNDFVRDTKCLLKVYDLGSLSSNIAWNLDAYDNFIGLKDIHYYDSDGKSLYKEEYDINYELKDNKLIFYSSSGLPDLSVFDKILVELYVKPTKLTSRLSNLDVNDDYYEAMLAKIMERYYAKFSKDADKWTAVQYWAGEYGRIRMQAQKEKYIQGDYTLPSIVEYYDAQQVIYYKPNENPLSINGVSDVLLLTYKYYLELETSETTHNEELGKFIINKQLNVEFNLSLENGEYQIFSNSFNHLKTIIEYQEHGTTTWTRIIIGSYNPVINVSYHTTPNTYKFTFASGILDSKLRFYELI